MATSVVGIMLTHTKSTPSCPPRENIIPLSNLKTSTKTTKTQKRRNPSGDIHGDGGSDNSLGFRASLPFHVKSITSTSNPFIKHCLKLRQSSSYRHAHGSVLVVGATPIREVSMFQGNLQESTTEMDCLFLQEEARIPQGLQGLHLQVVRVSPLVLKKLSGMQSTESVEAIALMRIPRSFIDLQDDSNKTEDCTKWFPSAHRILVLDSVQDPGNLGTLLRSAMAFNWDGAFLLPGCCDPFNDKALRASRGASFQLPIVSGTWSHLQLLQHHFQMKLLAANPAIPEKPKPISTLSQEFAQFLSEKPLCLVLGSEGQGLSEQSRRICELVSIPMAGRFESLNVSVAGGIFLYMLQPYPSF
ncbi:PREDICTED: uncharacterized protein LOC104804178 [Tarenaya hassleriana]|uniref:uncharacterized protein LOC104804178 n=1 Tax=Tarenaya hassleriana TaxID=28532 RepID=UPI00053C9F55|nr:PREDICTED: uncharacterized protein LOC104804178 [Tarenaya hassleriana]